ncbi:MAG: FtsQ-type POTRA domain-containing protein [Elusimicrobia bacterium]|nr:FtsQ-type POTRA domain-containing protein [Elusimicrobiota bacterium]
MSGRRIRRSRTYVFRSNSRSGNATKKLVKLSAFIILLCTLIYGIARGWGALQEYISKADILKIESIELSGSKNVLKGEILALLPFDIGDNIFSQDLVKAEKDVLKLRPELKKINIRRGFKKIIIKIQERIPVGFVNINGKRSGIDSGNVPFPLRGEFAKATLPEISAWNDFDREEILEFIEIFSEKAEEYFAKSVLFYFESVDDAAVKLSDGTRIIWGKVEKDKFDIKLKKMKEVLDDALKRFNKIDYVNLNYLDSGRVLVKPKGIFSKPRGNYASSYTFPVMSKLGK